MRKTEAESVAIHRQNLLLVGQHLNDQRLDFNELDSLLPGYLHVNRKDNLALVRMGNSGCEYLNCSEVELIGMGKKFLELYFDPVSQPAEHEKAINFFRQALDADVYGHSDRVRRDPRRSTYSWFLTFGIHSKLLDGVLMVSYPVERVTSHALQLAKALDDNVFMRKHHRQFASLTKREIEVVRRVACGEKRVDIAEQLCISVHTLDTHRKNIREKLSLRSFRDLVRYAESFDLLN